MKTIYILISIFIISAMSLHSQDLPPKQAYEIDVKQIHSGHSLTDPLFHPWPGQYRYLVYEILGGEWDNLGKATIPGSPMFWRWDNEEDLEPSARHDIHDWELQIITEGVPIPNDGGNPPQITPAKEYFSRYVNNAWENGNNGQGTPTLLWTTWTNIDDSNGPWRETLDDYESLWEEMMDYANDNLPAGATPVYLIPGHRMMMRIYDDIQLGIVPDVNSIDDIFSDNIHMNDWGGYAVAMIHYACIYNRNPVGLPNILFDSNNLPNHNPPSEELAAYLQEMIWDVVTSYDRTGISDGTSSINAKIDEVTIYPNPVESTLYFNSKEIVKFEIFNMQGKLVLSGNSQKADVSFLETGHYIVKINGVSKKFIKL